jgi:RNA polymerase sigma-32 factor
MTPEVLPKTKITKKSEDLKVESFDVASLLSKEIARVENVPLPALLKKDITTSKNDILSLYIKEINRHELLSPEQEKALVAALQDTGDLEIAKRLVLANLRLVVKIAMEYRSNYRNIMDLIQEGNIGLMKAVSKYDPTKGAKLSYYASWWIRSYILKFILDNFRLVKMGSSNDQKKLFYNLLKEKDRLASLGIGPDIKLLSENLGVSEKAVESMDMRLSSTGGEVSLDAPLNDESRFSFADIISDDSAELDTDMAQRESVQILKDHLDGFLQSLKSRDREIFEKRLLSEAPSSLQTIADEYGVSRERIRQVEERLLGNLKVYMSEYFR